MEPYNISNQLLRQSKEKEIMQTSNPRSCTLEFCETSKYIGMEITLPRFTSRINNTDSEKYFRQMIYVPFLDYFSSQISERLSKHKDTLSSLSLVLPKYCVNTEVDTSNFSMYSEFLDLDNLKGELDVWKSKWEQYYSLDRPDTALSAL